MKLFFISILTLSTTSLSANSGNFKLEKTLMDASSVEFIPHAGKGEWDNYLVMNLAFPDVAEVFKQLLVKEKRQLTSRGEAHLTIITPVEYWSILKPVGITMSEINELAVKAKIQSLSFKPVCLGRSSAMLDGDVESTFYIVVESSDVEDMRKAIKKLYISRGGESSKFDLNKYYPHITVGFTKRDLHESDKVKKDDKTCVYDLDLI